MLAKKKRLNLRLLNLPLFFKQTRCFKTLYFHAFYRVVKTSGNELCKIAVIAPKKASSKAVERNKLKRRAYSIAYQLFFNEKDKKSLKKIIDKQLQIVCVMKKKALLVSHSELKTAFQKLFLKFL